jgi:hypothetical protein
VPHHYANYTHSILYSILTNSGITCNPFRPTICCRQQLNTSLLNSAWRPVAHTLTWVVRPMFCMVLNILTQYPSHPFQATPQLVIQVMNNNTRPVHLTLHRTPFFHNGVQAKSEFEMCFDIGSKHWGQNTSPYAQGCDLSWTVPHIIYHDRSQPWAYGIGIKKFTLPCVCRPHWSYVAIASFTVSVYAIVSTVYKYGCKSRKAPRRIENSSHGDGVGNVRVHVRVCVCACEGNGCVSGDCVGRVCFVLPRVGCAASQIHLCATLHT